MFKGVFKGIELLIIASFLSLLLQNNANAYLIGDGDVKILAGISEAYDDNITYSNSNIKRDFITKLKLGLSAALEGKTRKMNLTANINQELYKKYHNFNNLSEDFTLNFLQEFSKFSRFKLSNSFIQADDPSSFEDAFGGTENRYRYINNSLNLGYTQELNKQFSLIFGYTNVYYAPSRSDLTNSTLNLGSVEADYAITSKTILLAMFEYQQRKFQHSISVATNRFAGGFRQYFTDQLYADCRAGKDYVTTSDNNKNNSAFISASIVNDFNETESLKLSYTKQDATTVYTRDIFRSQRISLSYIHQLSKRLGVVLSGFLGSGDYTDSDINDKYGGGSIKLAYDLAKYIKLNLSYNYSKTDSNVTTRDYNKGVTMLGLTSEF